MEMSPYNLPPSTLPQDAIDRGWLRQTCAASSPADLGRVLRAALDIARGMRELHAHDVVHAGGWGCWG
jgi:hypothetical protein